MQAEDPVAQDNISKLWACVREHAEAMALSQNPSEPSTLDAGPMNTFYEKYRITATILEMLPMEYFNGVTLSSQRTSKDRDLATDLQSFRKDYQPGFCDLIVCLKNYFDKVAKEAKSSQLSETPSASGRQFSSASEGTHIPRNNNEGATSVNMINSQGRPYAEIVSSLDIPHLDYLPPSSRSRPPSRTKQEVAPSTSIARKSISQPEPNVGGAPAATRTQSQTRIPAPASDRSPLLLERPLRLGPILGSAMYPPPPTTSSASGPTPSGAISGKQSTATGPGLYTQVVENPIRQNSVGISIGLGVKQAFCHVRENVRRDLSEYVPSFHPGSNICGEFIRAIFAKDDSHTTPDDLVRIWAKHALHTLSKTSRLISQASESTCKSTELDRRFFGYLVKGLAVEIWVMKPNGNRFAATHVTRIRLDNEEGIRAFMEWHSYILDWAFKYHCGPYVTYASDETTQKYWKILGRNISQI